MSTFKFSCPRCGQHIRAEKSDIGRSISCPTCHGPLICQPDKNRIRRRKNYVLLFLILILLFIFASGIGWVLAWYFQEWRMREALNEARIARACYEAVHQYLGVNLPNNEKVRSTTEKMNPEAALPEKFQAALPEEPQAALPEGAAEQNFEGEEPQRETPEQTPEKGEMPDPLMVTTLKGVLPSFSKLVNLSSAIEYAKESGTPKTITFNIPGKASLGGSYRIPDGVTLDGKNLATGTPMEFTGSFILETNAGISNFRMIRSPDYYSRRESLFTRFFNRVRNIIVGPLCDVHFSHTNAEDILIQKQGIVTAQQSAIHNLHIDFQGIFLYSADNKISGEIYIAGAIVADSIRRGGNGVDDHFSGKNKRITPQTKITPRRGGKGVDDHFSGQGTQVTPQTKITLDLSDWKPGEAMAHICYRCAKHHAMRIGYHCPTAAIPCLHPMLIDNMALFSGAEKYVIKVKKEQDAGTYSLAGNAAGAKENFFLQIEGSEVKKNLPLGVLVFMDGKKYLLKTRADNTLALTIANGGNVTSKKNGDIPSTAFLKLPSDKELVYPLERNPDGTITLSEDYLLLSAPVSPPFTINAVCSIGDSDHSVQFDFCQGELIFNWQSEHRELRLDIPGISSKKTGVADGSVPSRQWVTYKIRVTPQRIFVYVDGKLRHVARGKFENSFVGIHTDLGGGGMLQIKEFFVNREAVR